MAVVGATGLVGQEMIKVLEQRAFPVKNLKLLATPRSAGKKIKFRGEELKVEVTSISCFRDVDIALFAGGDGASQEYGREVASAGTLIVDNSSFFRMEPDVPLVVPEVNPEALKSHRGIIANPNCSTIQMVMVLKPIYDAAGIEKVIVSTYQSVSGTGKEAVEELISQSKAILEGEVPQVSVYPYQIAFNVLPHIGRFSRFNFTEEELKMSNETKKILGDDHLQVSATAVRVPVIRGHAESLYIETGTKISCDQVRRLLEDFPGIRVVDEPSSGIYPLSIDCADKDDVFVGRIREDLDCERGINMWIVADNLRKGAALNAVQILENVIQMNLVD